ncbi:MAG: 3-phosphoshikimate 1-carboxyvinyltransferase [Geobacteraceae bacterium]|nr:3-phosphoshikimate 1-carboxyvinyltransferase [Geobacteraceae bacterium]
MNSYTVQPALHVRGDISVPGDKSISHRAVMLGALGKGVTVVRGFLRGEDTFSTLNAFRAMGVEAREDAGALFIDGKGMNGLEEPSDVLDCGNSGTSMRLITGLLAGQKFFSVLTGDRYLRNRPMGRVIEPLCRMGANIWGRTGGAKAPLAVQGTPLEGISYASPVASAQVKSALLLAGLFATGDTVVTEPSLSRDHSERMLRYFGADVDQLPSGARIRGGRILEARDVLVPGDISSAAFFIVAALIVPGSELLISGVGTNPTRTGILDILLQMGASLELSNEREVSGEPVADILVRSSGLKGIEIGGELVPRAIDEFPVICVAAACAEGKTVLRDARELRVKETDRISAMAANLSKAGITVVETEDGLEIIGSERLSACSVDSFGDHRIAMSMMVAGLVADGGIQVSDIGCIETSFPGFAELLEKVACR